MKRIYCRACNACGLQEVLNLGRQPPSNALLASPKDKENYYPLRLVHCRACSLLQLDYDVPHDELFTGAYPYYSGQSKQWVEHCRQYADMIYQRLGLTKESTIYEIGGNDGTLLANFAGRAFFLANYEPSDSVADHARSHGIPTVSKAWGRGIEQIAYPPDLIIANNVMAHDPDLQGFVETTAKYLNRGGTFTAEFPWAKNLIEQTQFDTIYHEHYSYFSLRALIPLFTEHGLSIYDVEKLPTHGGSLRIYASHTGAREVTKHVNDVLHEEADLGKMETYWKFRERAYSVRTEFETFLAHLSNEYPVTLCAYGAAAKGNTFINWLGLRASDIAAVGDTTPAKIGKFLPGSRIPIVSEAQLMQYRPDYVLILPWNWTQEITEKLHCIRAWGGQFVTAIPELKVF